MTLRALVSSDWHFDGLRNHFPDDHAARVGREVRKVYQYAVDNGIPYLIVPGDIADNYRMTPESQREILSILVEYDSLVHTFYMMGNHDHGDIHTTSLDLFDSMSKELSLLKSFTIVRNKQIIELEGVSLNFLPFPHTELLPSKRPCINFIHKNVPGLVGDNGKPLKVKEDIVLTEGSFTFGGHIHKHQVLKSRNIVICGNLYQKNFGESLPKVFIEFKAKMKAGKLLVKWSPVETVPDFKLQTVHISEQRDFSKLSNNPLIRYRLYVAEGVVVPKDIRKNYPNIDQLWEHRGKKFTAAEDQFKQDLVAIPSIDPLTGLKEFFKAKGFSKQDYLMARKLVQELVP